MGSYFESSQFEVPNPNTTAQSDSSDRNNSHVHVSLAQVANLTRKEDGLVIHRQKVGTISAIGRVISIEEVTTKNVYLLEDYTQGGPVEVQLWKNESSESGRVYIPPPPIMENTYIRVTGQARFDERKPFIVAFSVAPITNPNEIPTHFLEVIADSLILEKRMNATLSKDSGTHMEANDSVQGVPSSGFNEIQRGVLSVLNKYGKQSACGLKRYEIKNYMGGVNEALVNDAISFLANEGHIFSTNDEDTFKSTDY